MTKTECFGSPFDDGEPIEIIENALSLIGSDKGDVLLAVYKNIT